MQIATRPGWLGRLAHYEIERVLGQGAFGIVVKAFDEKLHRLVAIKFVNPELATDCPCEFLIVDERGPSLGFSVANLSEGLAQLQQLHLECVKLSRFGHPTMLPLGQNHRVAF